MMSGSLLRPLEQGFERCDPMEGLMPVQYCRDEEHRTQETIPAGMT